MTWEYAMSDYYKDNSNSFTYIQPSIAINACNHCVLFPNPSYCKKDKNKQYSCQPHYRPIQHNRALLIRKESINGERMGKVLKGISFGVGLTFAPLEEGMQ